MKVPEKLYKYQSYSKKVRKALKNKEIWISEPSEFNDPFDCKVWLKDLNTQEKLYELCSAANKRRSMQSKKFDNPLMGMQMEQQIGPAFLDLDAEKQEEQIRIIGCTNMRKLIEVGVYSLTRRNDHLSMWAHYADHHKGFVIGFDTSKLVNADYIQIVEVDYKDDYLVMDVSNLTDSKQLFNNQQIIYSRKGPMWKTEEEWRLVFTFPYIGRLMPMPMAPVEIIFGHRMKKLQIEKLRSIMSKYNHDVQFFVAVPSTSKYDLNILPIDDYRISDLDPVYW